MINQFVWTDLSSYRPRESAQFYRQLFDWEFTNQESYYVGGNKGHPQVGIYETPLFFQKIKMPHFWMNYIQVNGLQEMVRKAKQLGAKIEIENQAFYGGKIALVRDPKGAGFTLYEGQDLKAFQTDSYPIILSRELHTSDAAALVPFYRDLFNWKIEQMNDHEYHIIGEDDTLLAKIVEVDNEFKGKYEYWVNQFGVMKLSASRQKVLALGGSVVSDEEERFLATDQFQEAFFYIVAA